MWNVTFALHFPINTRSVFKVVWGLCAWHKRILISLCTNCCFHVHYKVYLRSEQLHISIKRHWVFHQLLPGTNTQTLVHYFYIFTCPSCNFSNAEVIFLIFGTKTSTNSLINKNCNYQIPKILYFSTNCHHMKKYPTNASVNYNYQKLTYYGFLWPSKWNVKKGIPLVNKDRSFSFYLE